MSDKLNRKTDIELALAWQQGDRGAAAELLRRYRPLLWHLTQQAYRTEEPEDVAQNLALAFLIKAKHYKPEGEANFAGYITKMLHWAVMDGFRKARTHACHEELTLADQPEPAVLDVYDDTPALLSSVARTCHLTPKQTAVLYRWMKGERPGDTARALSLRRNSLTRMRAAIRQKLQDHKEELAEWMLE